VKGAYEICEKTAGAIETTTPDAYSLATGGGLLT
jgi:hypothetical protein